MQLDKYLGVDLFEDGEWHKGGGNFHSINCYYAILTSPFMADVVGEFLTGFDKNKIVIHDYGCGEGDGTMLLQAAFPYARVTGFDIHPTAVERSLQRWTDLNVFWRVGDVVNPEEDCDILLSLSTTDHVDVAKSINNCIAKSGLHIVAWPELAWNDDHPSQDVRWKEDVPTPSCSEVFPLVRVDWATSMVYTDKIQFFAWLK